MTNDEFKEITIAIAEVQGTIDAIGFIVSLPRFCDEERKRHERLAAKQAERLKAINDRIHEIHMGGDSLEKSYDEARGLLRNARTFLRADGCSEGSLCIARRIDGFLEEY